MRGRMSTLYIRNIDPHTATRLKQGAHARGWTYGQYLAALVQLHELAREDTGAFPFLAQIGLEPITR